jgi:hypothetical protein
MPAHTLQPTSLIHEAYLRLVEQSHPDYTSRAQFSLRGQQACAPQITLAPPEHLFSGDCGVVASNRQR